MSIHRKSVLISLGVTVLVILFGVIKDCIGVKSDFWYYLYFNSATFIIVAFSAYMFTRMSETRKVKLRNLDLKYKTLLDTINVIVLKWTVNGGLTVFNKYSQKFFGFTEREILGRNVVGTIVPEKESSGRDLRNLLRQIEIHPEKYMINENENVRKNGERVWVNWSNTAEYDESGNVESVLSVGFDLSDRKRREESIEKELEKVRADDRKKEIFLNNINFEIRNPLNAILGFSELLKGMDLEPRPRNCVEIIHDKSSEMLRLLNNILDFMNIENGDFVLMKEEVDISYVLRMVEDAYRNQAENKGLKLIVNMDSDFRAANVDVERLIQVLCIIVDNAVRYTDKGEVRIDMAHCSIFEDKTKVVFTVVDTGVGIKLEDQEGIYDNFFQATKDRTMNHKNIGFGLEMCRRIVERMGGQLKMRSVFGEGSEFKIIMDLELAPRRMETKERKQFKLKVLIVEDDFPSRILYEKLFVKFGCECVKTANGAEALIEFENNEIDLILTDLAMPIMDGQSLIRNIRSRKSVVPIIVLTGCTDNLVEKESYDVGVNYYIKKPFTMATIENVLENIFESDLSKTRRLML